MSNTSLEHNASYLVMRTNPSLTTNVKLVTNGDNMWLESYPISATLSESKYRAFPISGMNTYNKDVAKFYSKTSKDIAFETGQKFSEYSLTNKLEFQFENLYWTGAESIESQYYNETIGVIAPLFINRVIPKYFVVFKIKDPGNCNTTITDANNYKFDFDNMILQKSSIIKTFELTEKTPLGQYLLKYVNQPNFSYDPMYVNFSKREITYYGFDLTFGTMTKRVEHFEKSLCENDLTISAMDSWITNGWYRNNLVFNNIINLEFVFDDESTADYKFARYFGLYCNDLDFENNQYLLNTDYVQIDNEIQPISNTNSEYLNNSSDETKIIATDDQKIILNFNNE